jgi:LysR family transcriptional regulator, low CO2-responsive transcriptional regulator
MTAPLRIRFTFQQLRIFEAVARLGSVSRAAQELALSQPTLSIALRELSTSVGLPLIAQQHPRFALTQAGERVLAAARLQLREADQLNEDIARLRGLTQGRLRIAAVTTTEYFLPAMVGPFALAHPGLDISLSVENRDRVVARIKAALDDVAVMMYPPEELAQAALPFLDNPLVAITALDHPLVGKRVSLARFLEEPFLAREVGSGTRRAIEEHLAEHGATLRTRMQLGSNEAIKHAVAARLGVSILSRHTLAPAAAPNGIAIVRVTHLPIRRQWSVLALPGQERNPAVAAFLTHVRLQARQEAAL